MKSFLIIGLGKFGKHLALELSKLGNQVSIIDKNSENIEELDSVVSNSYIGDCTKPNILKDLGVKNYDICVVAVGTNFQASLEVTAELKELGAKYIVCKASSDIQGKFLTMAGANEIVYPEKDIAYKLARKYNFKNLFDFINLTEEYCIFETAVSQLEGQNLQDLALRKKYKINIIAIKHKDGSMEIPTAQYIFNKDDHIIVLCDKQDLNNFTKKL